MADLKEVIHTSKSTFDSIVDGTHATETYDENTLYCVELDEPVVLGAEGSGLTVNSDNELVVDVPTLKALLGIE